MNATYERHARISFKTIPKTIFVGNQQTCEILPLILNTIEGGGNAIDDKDDFDNVKKITEQLIKSNIIMYDSF